jgi:glycosyltransferase involved in cell wall biosynthesis
MAYMSLSVCILHKNDMLNLIRAMASVQRIADEILIIDSGSHNYSTIEARFPWARVLSCPGEFSFRGARNFALDNVKAEWVMFLDSDEEITPGSQETILHLMERGSCDAYAFVIVNFFGNGTWANFPVTKLFRVHPDVRFEKEIHETVNYSLMRMSIIPQIVNVFIAHYGYLKPKEVLLRKQQFYVTLLERQLNLTPKDAASYWYMATSLKILGQDDEAYCAVRRAIELEPRNKIPRLFHARFLISDSHFEDATEVLEALLQMPEAVYWNPTGENLLGIVRLAQNAPEEACKNFDMALNEQPWSLSSLVNRAICCEILHLRDEGIACCERAVGFMPFLHRIGQAETEGNPFAIQQDVSSWFCEKYNGSISQLYNRLLS